MYIKMKWRLLIATVLCIYGAAVVVLIRLVAHNLVLAILFGPTAAFLIYAAWLYFAETGRSRTKGRWFLVAGMAALIVELTVFARDIANIRSLVLLAILAAMYLWLIRILRKVYWRQRRTAGLLEHELPGFKHPALIINPKAGGGRSMKAHIDTIAKDRGIDVRVLRKGDDVETVARQSVRQGADVLGISGGDGSIGAVAKVALEYGLPMVVLPGGTRCHFARDIGLDRSRIADALEGFNGVRRDIDVGSINGRVFLNNVSFGLYADIVDNPDYRDNKLQVGRQVLQQITSGQKEPYDLSFKLGDRQFQKAVQVLVGVNRYQTLSLLELGHRERLDEGILQVTVIDTIDEALVRRLIRTMGVGHWLKRSAISQDIYQDEVRTFAVSAAKEPKLVVGVDGEREVYDTPVRVKVLPAALAIYVPAEGDRNRPKNAAGTSMIRQLWKALIHPGAGR